VFERFLLNFNRIGNYTTFCSFSCRKLLSRLVPFFNSISPVTKNSFNVL
jgi:hypothetical protein